MSKVSGYWVIKLLIAIKLWPFSLSMHSCYVLGWSWQPGAFKIRSLISSPAQQLVGERNPREKVSYYSSQDWAERYWYEFRLSRKKRVLPLRWLEESSFQRQNHRNRSEWHQIDARRGLQRQIF